MQPTMQKNNVKQRKTIAIIAMIAVAAIALAAVAIIAVSNKREMTQAASDTCALMRRRSPRIRRALKKRNKKLKKQRNSP